MEHDPKDDPRSRIHEAVLDDGEVARLLEGLADGACIDEVRVKAGVRERASPAPVTLEHAREELAAGRAFAIQIRYRRDGAGWIDTLTRGPDGVRLVRVQEWSPPEGR